MIVYNRYKNCQVDKIDDGIVKVIAAMCDTIHEIQVTLIVDLADSKILKSEAEFLRQPNDMCKETAIIMEKMVGVSLSKGISKKAKEILGGSSGCTHLVDLVIEAAKAFIQSKYTMLTKEFKDIEEANEALTKELEGNCWYYSRHLRGGANDNS